MSSEVVAPTGGSQRGLSGLVVVTSGEESLMEESLVSGGLDMAGCMELFV